jgi:hypothetical protein
MIKRLIRKLSAFAWKEEIRDKERLDYLQYCPSSRLHAFVANWKSAKEGCISIRGAIDYTESNVKKP